MWFGISLHYKPFDENYRIVDFLVLLLWGEEGSTEKEVYFLCFVNQHKSRQEWRKRWQAFPGKIIQSKKGEKYLSAWQVVNETCHIKGVITAVMDG
jgi:hypothetical protein